MASKDDKKSEEGYEFKIPDFDEDGFIHKEMVSFRTTSILFVVGILTALLSWLVYELMGGAKAAWFIGLALMGAVAYGLRFLFPLLKVDIRHFGRREWFGTFFLFFFAWLAFFILFLNPPISDHADPTASVFASPQVQMAGDDVRLDLFIADNYRIDSFTFTVTQGGLVIANQDDLTQSETFPDRHSIVLEDAAPGTYTMEATVVDRKGNEATAQQTFLVDTNAVDVTLPADGSLDQGDRIFVGVPGQLPCTQEQYLDGGDCVRYVALALSSGEQVVLEYSDIDVAWQATRAFTGWERGSNSFDVVVQFQDQFHGIERIVGGVTQSGPYTVTVSDPQDSKTVDIVTVPATAPVSRQTPGVGAVAFIAVLGGAAILARRRQE